MFKQIFKSIKGRGFRSILIILAVLLIIVPATVEATDDAAADIIQTEILEPVNPNAINESFSRNVQTKIQITNDSSKISKNIKIQVPLISVDSDYQETVNTTYSIKPTKVSNEGFNTSNGTFLIDSIAPGSTETVLIDYEIIINPAYTLSAPEVLSDETTHYSNKNNNKASNLKEYLKPSQKIQSDNSKIKSKALQITQDLDDDLEKARKIFTFVKEHMQYNFQSPHRNKDALSALTTGEGVCEDYAVLFVALSRAAGIPARQVNGYAGFKVPSKALNTNLGKAVSLWNYRHSWVEFYIEDMGWLPADPTFSSKNDEFKYFGYLPFDSRIAQNYLDQSLKVNYQGSSNGLKVEWEEALIN